MSECDTCQDRRLVGGFLPAPCPSCAGGVSAERVAALAAEVAALKSEAVKLKFESEHWRLHAKMMARAADTEKAEREYLRGEVAALKARCAETRRIAKAAANLAARYIDLVIADLDDDEEIQDDLGQTKVWLDQLDNHPALAESTTPPKERDR